MNRFKTQSTVREVIENCPEGREILADHGYQVGEVFVDQLSQNQSLQFAARSGRLRNLEGLLERLNVSTND